MPNIPAARSTSGYCPVAAALFAPGFNTVIGDAIYYLPSTTAKVQHSYHCGGYISPAANIGTVFALPNLYSAANSDKAYGGNSGYPCYLPSGL